MNVIRIPTPLRPYTAGLKEVEVEGQTVAEALESLAQRYPAVHKHLFDENGALRPYVNLFLNDLDIRQADGPATPIRDGDRLMIIPSIAGG